MAEAVLETAEQDESTAFLGMSSDVLFPQILVKKVLDDFERNNRKDTVLFVELPESGHKKWEFIIDNEQLIDIKKREVNTKYERALLIMTKKSLLEIRKVLKKPIKKKSIPKELKGFQEGWILLLKTMILLNIPLYGKIVNIPILNINVSDDFIHAEKYVGRHLR
jgi:hypothetical protein